MLKPVFSIQWHITTMCGQRCKHCYLFNSSKSKIEIEGEKKIDFETMKLIADDLVVTCKKLGATPRTSITGGDPILHPFFWELLEYLKLIGVRVSILGNPFKINRKVAQRLAILGVTRYQLSLDGFEKTHDYFRKQGSFKETFRAARDLQAVDIKVGIMSTVSKLNADQIPSLIELIVKEEINSYAFARYCPTQNDTTNMFSPLEYRRFLDTIWRVYSKYSDSKTKFTLKDHLWLLYLKENGLFKCEDTKGVIVSGCGLGVSHLSVLADGTVFACRRFDSPIGQVPTQSFYDIFTGDKLNKYRNYSNLKKCKDCELLCYCRGCMAVAYGYNNDWTDPDPQCWK